MNRPKGVSEKAAPYMRARPTHFYPEFANGTYALDIAGCHWTCENCWSSYGWRGKEAPHWWEPDEAVDRAIEGMKRNAQTCARLTGGEASMYWDHLYEFCKIFLDRTQDRVMHIPGFTQEEGDPLALLVETNGSLLSPEKLDMLDDLGEGAYRLILNFGLKATTAEGLADLTGMDLEKAEKFHDQQYENFIYAVRDCERIDVMGSLLDQFTDPEDFARLQRRVQRWFPTGGDNLSILQFKKYPNKPAYTPKRFRWGFFPSDEVPDVDEEVLLSLASTEGEFPSTDELAERDLFGDEPAEFTVGDAPAVNDYPPDFLGDLAGAAAKLRDGVEYGRFG
jgi:uncharacterized Fe-S cluster-containing radical SAM superfamily protein